MKSCGKTLSKQFAEESESVVPELEAMSKKFQHAAF
jgi:hypothetical protein